MNKRDQIAAGLVAAAEALGVHVLRLRRDAYNEIPLSVRGFSWKSIRAEFDSWQDALVHAASLAKTEPPSILPPSPVAELQPPFELPDPWGRVREPEAPKVVTRDKGEGATLLVIPDAHAHPNHDNDRFEWLGRYVAELRPTHILCLGDWWDLASICTHSKPGDVEGARMSADLEVGWDAMRRFVTPWHGGDYAPEMTFCLGNHEARLDSQLGNLPVLKGSVADTRYLAEGLKTFGWTVHKFKETARVLGYAASHYLPSGTMGRPIGGVHAASSHIRKCFSSTITGHSHLWDYSERSTASGQTLQAIVAGWYGHPGMIEGWNRNTASMWRNAVTVIRNVRDGFGDVEQVSQERLRRQYK